MYCAADATAIAAAEEVANAAAAVAAVLELEAAEVQAAQPPRRLSHSPSTPLGEDGDDAAVTAAPTAVSPTVSPRKRTYAQALSPRASPAAQFAAVSPTRAVPQSLVLPAALSPPRSAQEKAASEVAPPTGAARHAVNKGAQLHDAWGDNDENCTHRLRRNGGVRNTIDVVTRAPWPRVFG